MTQRSDAGFLTLNSQPAKSPPAEFFKRIIRESGIKLNSNDDPNVLTQEQALVVRDINKLLEDEGSDDKIDLFIRGFKVLIRKEKYLTKALLPTVLKKATSQGSLDNSQEQQESLFRIFLTVTSLHSQIVDIILDDVTSTVAEDAPNGPHLRLLLAQLRYLPHISDAETLATKLVDIIDVASYPSQLEILESIPDILPDSEYNQTATQLAQLLDTNDNLSAAIVDCLNALTISPDIRAQIQDHVLAKLLAGTSPQVFPVFIDFLLSDYNQRSLSGTLFKIRNALHALLGRGADDESNKIVVFGRIQRAARSKPISDGWLSVITSIKAHADHKPVDLLLLFMLHACNKVKKRNIETTVRKRVKDGHFKPILVDQLFDKFMPQQFLRDYFNAILEIAAGLLRSSAEIPVTDFATTLLKRLFTNEHTGRTFRQEILENVIVLVGSKNTNVILDTLLDLITEIGHNPNHTIILMRLLERLDSFDMRGVKLVFEILCGLSCAHESLLGLKEEIHMVIRKNLSSSKRLLKNRGIVAAVVMAKSLAATDEEQSSIELSEESILTVAQLKGGAKEAAAILELANTSTSGCPDLLGLYYDQLATMLIKPENLDKHFLAWLFETATHNFQNIFVTENVCTEIDDLEVSVQYNINTEEEIDAPLSVNIAGLTLKPDRSNSIVVLAPHFRLLRLLHYKQQNGDLSSIDALLGCGVVLPKTDNVDVLGAEQLRQVSDCLFHCINWFREVISAFVTQKNTKLRRKVIQRLDDLHQVEQLLNECLQTIPEHKLPTSYFETSLTSTRSPVKDVKPKRLKKKLKSREILDDSNLPTPSTSAKRVRDSPPALAFREVDTDIVKLLKYPLGTDSVQITLNINQLNFILRDFNVKLNLLTKNSDLGSLHLNVVSPLQLIQDCVPIASNLNAHLTAITKEIRANDDINRAFGLIIESLCLIFSWQGFQHVKHLDLLRDILRALHPNSSSLSVAHMSVDLIERLATYADHSTSSLQAVHLIKTMEALQAFAPDNQAIIAKTAAVLLNRRWEDANATNLESLLKSYLSNSDIKSLCGLVGTLQVQVVDLKRKTDVLDLLKSISKTNFYILYRNLLGCLHDRVKTEIQSLTNAQHLVMWRATALTMQGLMTVAKAHENKSDLVCFLKKSISILKIFLTHGVPILEIELKSKPDQVVEIFKTIQSTTRFLHHLCCYSKLKKDASLMAHVPQFRLMLESLVYRVKAALVANDCSAAFWMGNLKNRDLHGEDILTQTTDNSETTNHDDEDVPSDDSHLSDDRNKSGSEVFE